MKGMDGEGEKGEGRGGEGRVFRHYKSLKKGRTQISHAALCPFCPKSSFLLSEQVKEK